MKRLQWRKKSKQIINTIITTAFLATQLVVPLSMSGVFNASASATDKGNADSPYKVTICHRTNSTTNPYQEITVDFDAATGALKDNGQGDHTSHTGPIFDPNTAYPTPHNGDQWGDIIPSYTYPGDQQHAAGSYAGLNYDATGQAYLANHCNVLTVTPLSPTTTTPNCEDPTEVVTPQVQAGITWTPSGTTTLQPGDAVTYTATPKAGYTIASGAQTSFTFTNDFNIDNCVTPGHGSITIKKNAVPDSPRQFNFQTTGSGLSNFSLVDDSGAGLPEQDFTDLNAGTYTVTESTATNWDLTGLTCTESGQVVPTDVIALQNRKVTITLDGSVQNVTCTFVNHEQPTISVTKVVQNNYNGTASASDFPLYVNQTEVTTGATNYFAAGGQYAVSETGGPSGYHQVSAICLDQSQADIGTNFKLAYGDAVTCTITNADNPPTVQPCSDSTGTTEVTPTNLQGFDFSETRSTGHHDFTLDGLHIYTDGATSTDKVAGYKAVDVPLTDVGQTTMDYTSDFGLKPGYQLVIDFNHDGSPDGILVGEPDFYGTNWWLSNGSGQFVKDNAPHNGGGYGSQWYGTLNEWLSVFPKAQVTAFGFSLGSGVYASGTLHSIDFGCHTYHFSRPPQAQIRIKKQLWPKSDNGKFNLNIDGTTYANNVGNGGDTGYITVDADTIHTLSETAGTNTNLSNYRSKFYCSYDTPVELDISMLLSAKLANQYAYHGRGTSFDVNNLHEGDKLTCTFVNKHIKTSVAPGEVSYTQPSCEVRNGKYTIPSTVGVDYKVSVNSGAATVMAAGTYNAAAGSTVTITPVAQSGYKLTGNATPQKISFNNVDQKDCVLDISDVCPNLPGDQATVPSGYTKDTVTGNCVTTPIGGKGGEVLGASTELANTGQSPWAAIVIGLTVISLTLSSAFVSRKQCLEA